MSLRSTIEAAQHYLNPQHVDCVVYHNPCNDGSGAALSAWTALGNKAVYEKRAYHKEFNTRSVVGKNVVVLDASFKKEELRQLQRLANKIMILDHHDSAMRDLAGEAGCFFEMQNSGAMLAWHYFHGLEKTPPKLIQLIEDRDLWRWEYRDESEPLYYALRVRCSNNDFKTFEQYLDPVKLDELIAYGKTLVEENHRWCKEAALQAQERLFRLPGSSTTYNIMCLELPNDKLVSELAEYLYSNNNVDFIMMWCKAGDQYKISLRSGNLNINLGEIAASLGGGGHRQAAGAVITTSPWDLLKN